MTSDHSTKLVHRHAMCCRVLPANRPCNTEPNSVYGKESVARQDKTVAEEHCTLLLFEAYAVVAKSLYKKYLKLSLTQFELGSP